ncbi:unnamed protein product [Anisakis simplex]|uniref:Secreted protein n=1 Tax=Anisakis simplex TaxID=6269 RepID=A0A0M3KK90_ANISI|nr:unnamed protein product [Anisakis simplex]
MIFTSRCDLLHAVLLTVMLTEVLARSRNTATYASSKRDPNWLDAIGYLTSRRMSSGQTQWYQKGTKSTPSPPAQSTNRYQVDDQNKK